MLKKELKKPDFYIDPYLWSNLGKVYDDVRYKDYDSFLIISGREGFGKSTLAGQIAKTLDPTYCLDRCAFTSQQFIEACENADKYQAVVFDETMGYLSSRGSMSKFNRQLIKIFSEMRSKNLFVIICIPNFFELDRYPAMHRSTGLLHVATRGRYGSYDYRKKKQLYLLGKKTYSYVVPPSFKGNFNKFFPLDKEEYEKKKQLAIREWENITTKEERAMESQKKLIAYLLEKKLLKNGEISAITGYSHSRISRMSAV